MIVKSRLFKLLNLILLISLITACKDTCKPRFIGQSGEVKLITLAPGHFHAHLVQKSMYNQVDPTVYVYAPEGPEVEHHLLMIESYNSRVDNPTSWNQVLYIGSDYLERMLAEKGGNVVVLAGNNRLKTSYIKRTVDKGMNVLSDKPMAINSENFELLRKAFDSAAEHNVILYDIMTNRYAINNILQKELMMLPAVFGNLEKGRPGNPSVIKESVHYLFKHVSGRVLRRPPWYFDVNQQGEGIVDVTAHLVDLIQWVCFPGEIIDYMTDIAMLSATRWPTALTGSQFESITGESRFPAYLDGYIENDTVLQFYCNGEMNYTINGVHARVTVKWDYRARDGTGDTHYSLTRGSNCNLIMRQGAEQNFKPVLYIEPASLSQVADFEKVLVGEFPNIQAKYPGVELKKLENSWEVLVPAGYDDGHEAHFARVTEKYLQYLIDGKLPDWEVPNMIAKYYTTTRALEMARESK